MALAARILSLRHSPLLLRLPPYLSALCILVGIAWLLILPLNEYSRGTYVSENAILPAQVHTYFGGSEHNIFRAYRQEVYALSERSEDERRAGLEGILRENGLKAATQRYSYRVAGEVIAGTNVYGILQGPRADATEAMVLLAAWRNFEGEINYSGLALALTLARYFKRWSIWSKDIILLIPEDSTYGPEAWLDAYHTTSPTGNVSALPVKAGALQAAVALDYPAGPWGQRFDKLDIAYDGINGALPNLDLLNTAVQIATGQMGIGCTLHNLPSHSDNYLDRLKTLSAGILTQSAGHATGPHSAFMPYHIDAITLKTVGDGWHDEMSLGRTVESVFRSLNNLLEHLHQSFFFYILLNTSRFVSIGNYLPAAMILAGSFTITALALWVQSGTAIGGEEVNMTSKSEMEVVKIGGDMALVPKKSLARVERQMFVPALVVLGVHLAGFVPLWSLTHMPRQFLTPTFLATTAATIALPIYLARQLTLASTNKRQTQLLTQSFSLLLLSATLSTLATLNFSLAFLVAAACAPLNFIRPLPCLPRWADVVTKDDLQTALQTLAVVFPSSVLFVAVSPPVVLFWVSQWFGKSVEGFVLEAVKGWVAQGVWTAGVVWCIWWPAWVLGGVVLWSGVYG